MYIVCMFLNINKPLFTNVTMSERVENAGRGYTDRLTRE